MSDDAFCYLCHTLAQSAHCPACGQLPARVYVRRAKRGFAFIGMTTFDPLCGLMLCRSCAFLLIVPRGGRIAVIPPESLVYDLMKSSAGHTIAECMRAIRLEVGPPIHVTVGKKKR